MAWWGLSRALERWGRGNHAEALLKADKLKDNANDREQQLILARMQLKGQVANVGNAEQRKQKAIATINRLIALYDDDEEAWICRAELAGGGSVGAVVGAVPFCKALLRIHPL